MATLRCTKKLLDRFSGVSLGVEVEATTVLGDWFANILFTKPQLILCISERTLLPVVLPAKSLATLPERLPVAIAEMLTSLGIDQRLIDQELSQMQDVQLGRTNNRRVLGSLNDFMYLLEAWAGDSPRLSLLELSHQLADTPCTPLGGKSPMTATTELFAAPPAP